MCVCVCVSLSLVKCNINPLHVQRVGIRVQTMKERKTIYDSSALKLDNVKAYLLTYLLHASTRVGAFTTAVHYPPSFACLTRAFIFIFHKSHSASSSQLFLGISLLIQDSDYSCSSNQAVLRFYFNTT